MNHHNFKKLISQLADSMTSTNTCSDIPSLQKPDNWFRISIGPPPARREPRMPLSTRIFIPEAIQQFEVLRSLKYILSNCETKAPDQRDHQQCFCVSWYIGQVNLDFFCFRYSELIFTWSKFPKNIQFNCENNITESPHHLLYSWSLRTTYLHSDFVVADVSIRSPWRLFIFIIKNSVFL